MSHLVGTLSLVAPPTEASDETAYNARMGGVILGHGRGFLVVL